MKYTYASPQAKKLLEYEPKELIGKTLFDFMSEEEEQRIRLKLDEVIRQGHSFENLECFFRCKRGHSIAVEVSGVPWFDDNGHLKGYRGISRDITERKDREEIKAEFLAMVSHE